MALLNPSFEDAGALPGEAAHWTLTGVTSREVIAAFGAARADAFESFERWFSFLDVLAPSSTVLALFDGAREARRDRRYGAGSTFTPSEPARRAPAVTIAARRTAGRLPVECRWPPSPSPTP